MAAWAGLGQAATVAQLVGVDVGGLISMIIQAAVTARQNQKECEQLARRVFIIAELLPHLQDDPDQVTRLPLLAGLDDTLRDAHELVVSCQGRSAAYQFVTAGRQAERFREVQSRIDSYLIVFPVISHIGITRRLNRIYNILVPDDATSSPSPLLSQSSSPQLQVCTSTVQIDGAHPEKMMEIAKKHEEVLPLPHRTEEFTLAEIVAATNNFALDTKIGEGGSGMVYRGRLHDGREVAIKRVKLQQQVEFLTEHPILTEEFRQEEFLTELAILSRLRHKHIVRFFGWYMDKDKRLLSFRIKKQEQGAGSERDHRVRVHGERLRHKHIVRFFGWYVDKDKQEQEQDLRHRSRSRIFRTKKQEQEQDQNVITVYEYMENGTLYDHLHHHQPSSSSPVTVSWKMRIDVLVCVSRAIEHLHCHAVPPVIHGDIKSENILFDASWVPRVSDFGLSVVPTNEEDFRVAGTIGYIDPAYYGTRRLKPTSDVYSLGVLMLEVLTGMKAVIHGEENGELRPMDLACFALPIIEAGDLVEVLDRRPAPEPTPRQLEPLEHVAQTAACCLELEGEDRPAISDVVASLETALEHFCSCDSRTLSDSDIIEPR